MSRIVTAPDSTTPKPATLTREAGVELERLRGGLRIIALRTLGDPDAAEEAVQETLARACIAIEEGRLGDPAKLPAYVAGIARHVCSHMLRDRKHTVPLDGTDHRGRPIAHDNLAVQADPLEALISDAETGRLRRAFKALPLQDQRLLRLCFHGKRSSAEVAEALSASAEAVRKQKSRALDRLRQAFFGDAGRHERAPSGTVTVKSIDSSAPPERTKR
jgi:RNA polymerase sigma factor (sigma-70 family)